MIFVNIDIFTKSFLTSIINEIKKRITHMYILGIGSEFLPATVIVDYIVFCGQLFYCLLTPA